jgi:hypothetical protein
MTKYLISFPSSAMQVPSEEFHTVVDESHDVVQEARDAGVLVFAGGIAEEVAPALVHADGTVTTETIHLDGGFTVLELPTRDAAVEWAAKIAAACRCPQELRQFGEDAAS